MKKRSAYISNLPPLKSKQDSIMWICIICKETQNENGNCANLMNNICPGCYFGNKEQTKFVKSDRLEDGN